MTQNVELDKRCSPGPICPGTHNKRPEPKVVEIRLSDEAGYALPQATWQTEIHHVPDGDLVKEHMFFLPWIQRSQPVRVRTSIQFAG